MAGMIRFITVKSDEFGMMSANSFTTVNLTISLACTTPVKKGFSKYYMNLENVLGSGGDLYPPREGVPQILDR